MELEVGPPKCRNTVIPPGEIVGGVSRETNGLSASVSKELRTSDPRLATLLATFVGADLPDGVFPLGLMGRLPYNSADKIKLLGITIDTTLACERQVGEVLQRVAIRHGVMAQLPRGTRD